MFSSKYYDNPFADDDDDLCYGEILPDQGEIVSGAGHPSAERREGRLSLQSAGSQVTASRRNAAEASITETPPPATNSGDECAPAALSGQLSTRRYEEYIMELRAELESANAEKNRLTATQTKAESRARSLLFEKESVEWQLHLEKERSHTLAEKVAALEIEVEQMASRASEVAHRGEAALGHANHEPGTSTHEAVHSAMPHHVHVDPCASSLKLQQASKRGDDDCVGQNLTSPPLPEWQRNMRARAPLEQRQAANEESRGGSFERGGADASPDAAPEAETSAEPTSTATSSALTRSLRGQRRAEAVQKKILQQQRLADEQAAEVKELEELLQTHCQKRDELTTQLQRLESMRLRTVAEKRRKAAVEVSLEEEEKTIGRIRLELRSHSALLR
ncbi:hypothetical protein ABL78_7415 [Leptomonas seymouri]|uniref:Uncharacterized protein n=1 Tax=Leptomonas seymouri TaxID=5684 RepID=A0A0N1I207_LEPSE|nr:hypothetical protein ABL78_7415 [Leptomonas seymouri]|eukprot:KPI83558.1 hypothetical protein ABL78_7415 [Leptomonas seymouri]